ncbi:MAG: M23 family metallopeptidase [Bacteroidales bacterium]|nr:M23 family metallopeptidase [Bacteroidales bacterium]
MKKIIPIIIACLVCFASCSTAKKTTSPPTDKSTPSVILTLEEMNIDKAFKKKQGKLPWPVSQGVKVFDYGTHPHPNVPSVTVNNHGIDIETAAGTPVRAIFQGEVTSVIEILGKKVIMIRHGSFISVYQNVTDLLVKKGDKVKAKQTIATVSKEDDSEQYILHFELWENTSHVNPNHWLSKRIH